MPIIFYKSNNPTPLVDYYAQHVKNALEERPAPYETILHHHAHTMSLQRDDEYGRVIMLLELRHNNSHLSLYITNDLHKSYCLSDPEFDPEFITDKITEFITNHKQIIEP